MMRPLIVLLASLLLGGQVTPAPVSPCGWSLPMKTEAENLNFADGAVGVAPRGWLLGPEWAMAPHTPIYEAFNVSGEQCHGSQQCATVHSVRAEPSVPLTILYQDVDVTQHRGHTLIYRAYVRVDSRQKSVARLLIHLHTKACSSVFREDMGDRPITSGDWALYEIRAPIAPDAFQMEFGLQLIGQGAAWIDKISMEYH